MPFIGNQPAEAYSSFQKQDFTTSATTSYTLDHPVANGNEIALFINFVRQEPTAAYTASGTSLTLTSATSSSDDMYCVYLGKAVQTVNPPNSSVGSSQVSADLITGQTALGATPADTDELLISDAGTLKRVDYSYLKSANTPAFFVYKTGSTQSISSGTITKVTFNTELYDTDNNFDNSTNYRFTPTTAGKYFFSASIYVAGSSQRYLNVYIRKNGSTNFGSYSAEDTENNLGSAGVVANVSYDMNGSSDYVEVFAQSTVTSGNIQYDNNGFTTYFQGYKLIGV